MIFIPPGPVVAALRAGRSAQPEAAERMAEESGMGGQEHRTRPAVARPVVVPPPPASPDWAARAERLLEQALDEIRDNADAISAVSAAEVALHIAYGELPAEDLDYWPGPYGWDDREVPCTCPPGLVERGGFRGNCPAHGYGETEQL